MRKQIITYLFLSICCLTAHGQENIAEVLRAIESNNKELKANAQLVVAQKMEARSDNNLSDPKVSYSYLWGAEDKNESISELVVSQSFDFPTLYAERAKLNKLKYSVYDQESTAARQSILLQAKELCLDIIMLRQQEAILKERLSSAEKLATIYQQKLSAGDATVIETNKINLELLNVKTEARLNENSLRAKLDDLTALNGNIPIDFAATQYPSTLFPDDFQLLKREVMDNDPTIKSIEHQQQVARKQLAVNRQGWIPKFELGYRRNTETGAPFNGVIVGISIPLFENSGKVKMAKAQALTTNYQADNAEIQIETALKQQYQEASSLYSTMNEYQRNFLAQQDIDLLKQAVTGGQISMIEYFVEISVIYQSKINYLQLENQYQKLMAQMYKYKL